MTTGQMNTNRNLVVDTSYELHRSNIQTGKQATRLTGLELTP